MPVVLCGFIMLKPYMCTFRVSFIKANYKGANDKATHTVITSCYIHVQCVHAIYFQSTIHTLYNT